MPKNILIFSDGIGQAGGVSFDERRSNIYKLYLALSLSQIKSARIDGAVRQAQADLRCARRTE